MWIARRLIGSSVSKGACYALYYSFNQKHKRDIVEKFNEFMFLQGYNVHETYYLYCNSHDNFNVAERRRYYLKLFEEYLLVDDGYLNYV